MESIAIKVGIDVSKDSLDVCIGRSDGQKRYRFANSEQGVSQLAEVLGGGEYLIALEATGRYESLARHMLESAGFNVAVQNPRCVRSLAKGMGIQAKTDGIDARVLSQTAELCAKNEPRSKEREALGDLSRTIETMKKERSGHKMRLGVPGLSEAAAASILRIVRALDAEIKTLEKEFVRQIKGSSLWTSYKLVQTVFGAGPVLARIAVCELPENLEEWSGRQLASYAAVAPLDNSSGKRAGKARVGKHGNLHLKAGLYMPALSAVREGGWGRETYLRLCAKGLEHQQALIPVMRKMLLRIVCVMKRGSAWQPDPPQRT